MRLKISGGRVFDPSQGWQGEVRDLYIKGDRIVPPLTEVDRRIDAQGRVVLAGGIELRGQVATYGLNFLRLWGRIPSPEELGKGYAALGYTHVHEPFLTLATANYVHRELAALPVVDTSASLGLNLRDLDLWLKPRDRLAEVGQTVLCLLDKTRALNLRVVEPFVRYRQDFYAHRTIRTEEALEILAELALAQGLAVALETSPEVLYLSLPEPRVFHLAALGPALITDDLEAAAEAHLEKGATGDLGLLDPQGPGRNGIPPVRLDLGWFRPLDLGAAPDAAVARRALTLALRYQGDNLAFSGAGALTAPLKDYPKFFSWLWDAGARRQDWGEALSDRHYSLSEWVWATRNLPARLLGLKDRGHLGLGARADVAIYDLAPETSTGQWLKDLGYCHTLIKAGEIVIDDFRLVKPEVAKATYYRRTEAESGPLLAEICRYRSFRPENLWVQPWPEITWVAV